MWNKKFMQRVAIVSMLGSALVLTVAACSSGVSEEQYKTTQDQLSKEQQKSAALQDQLNAAKKQADDLQKQVQAGGASSIPGGIALLGVKQVPPPGPKATPTPPPPGFTPPPPPKVPASFFQPVQVFIYADTVTSGLGESPFNIDPAGAPGIAASCVQTGVFKRGQHAVWRFQAFDATTGKALSADEVASAKLTIPNVDPITGRFGRHGKEDTSPWFWTAAWNVPLDYPLGVLDWTVTVTTKDGKTGAFKQIVVGDGKVVESRTQIAA